MIVADIFCHAVKFSYVIIKLVTKSHIALSPLKVHILIIQYKCIVLKFISALVSIMAVAISVNLVAADYMYLYNLHKEYEMEVRQYGY